MLMEEYNSLLINRGRTVQVQEPEGNWRGTALGIDREGCLLVEKEEGSVEKVFAGEVSVRGVYAMSEKSRMEAGKDENGNVVLCAPAL